MIKFRKSRRDSELSLMAQAEVNRRSSAISLTGLRRDSVTDGELYLTVPQYRRRGSTTTSVTEDDAKVLPAITRHLPEEVKNDDNVSIHSDEITIDFSGLNTKAKDDSNAKDSAKVNTSDVKVISNARLPDVKDKSNANVTGGSGPNGDLGEDRRISTASMVYGDGTSDLKVNNEKLVKRIWLNQLVMSVSFMLLFSSIAALAALQSSIHEGNLGVVGLAVNFGTVVVSCLVVPHVLIRYIGYKWTVTLCMLGAVGWMICNIFGIWETVIPGSIMLGLAWAPLWTAHSAYVTNLSKKYALLTAITKEEAISKFFGIFYTMFLTAPVWGNLVSAGVFGGFGGGDAANMTTPDEEEANRELLKYCGANFCPLKEVPANETAVQVERPTFEQVALLVGINVGITMLGCILTAVLVDRENSPMLKLPPQVGVMDDEEKRPMKELLLATIKQTLRKKQLLMIPFPIYVGLEQAFVLAEFTSAYVGCAAGIEYVSLTVICYGIVGGLFAVLMGILVDKTGRVPVFLVAAGVHIGLIIFLRLWQIQQDHIPLFFVVPALWGVGDAIFQSQLNTMYGNMFSDNSEAAFANYRMFESVGFILGYGYSGLLCVYVKLYVLLILLPIAVAGYLAVEVLLQREGKAAEKMTKVEMKGQVNRGQAQEETGSRKKKTSASSPPTLETMVESDDEDAAQVVSTIQMATGPSKKKPSMAETNC